MRLLRRFRNPTKSYRRYVAVALSLGVGLGVASAPASAETNADANDGELTASGARSYSGAYRNWTDPCPDGEWNQQTGGLVIAVDSSDEEGPGSTSIVIDFERKVGFIPLPDFKVEKSDNPAGPTGIDAIEDGIAELSGGEFTVWTNDNCPWGQEISYVPANAEQLLPDFYDLAKDRLPEPELLLEPFDEEEDWTFVQVPLDFRTTPETVEDVVVTIDSGGPDPVWVTITAVPTTLTYRSGDPLASGDRAEVTCDVRPHATAPYVAESPGECSYAYQNASSVADGNIFEAELILEWEVTYESSDGPGTLVVDPTVQVEQVRIAEAKAVNIYSRP